MRKDGPADFRIDASLGQNRLALHGMVGRVRMNLVVEIMQQRCERPLALILTELSRIRHHARFHRERVFAQALRLCVFTKQIPGLFSFHPDSVANTVSETRMLSFEKAPLAWACGAVGSARSSVP